MQNNIINSQSLKNIKAIFPFLVIFLFTIGGYFLLSYYQTTQIGKLKNESKRELEALDKEEAQRKIEFNARIEQLKTDEKSRLKQYSQLVQQAQKEQESWKQELHARRLQEDRQWSREIDNLREAYKREQYQIAQMEERKRRDEQNRRAALRAQTERERRQNAYRFAERAKSTVINEVYDGGRNQAVNVKDWRWLGNGYRIDMYLSWNGSIIGTNSYSAEGYITCDSNGRNVKWNQTWASSSVQSYLKNRNMWAGIIVGGMILSNID